MLVTRFVSVRLVPVGSSSVTLSCPESMGGVKLKPKRGATKKRLAKSATAPIITNTALPRSPFSSEP